tara:strand:+ start:332 stop:1180 length:849 start_codon:yes stop_codon:yes gene_type:complete
MKKTLLLLLVLTLSFTGYSQIKTPQPSPSGALQQTVGLTTVSIEYSRPSMRGRTIFGELVPYGKVWRTGANANTKFKISDGITIDGKRLNAGTYAIYTIPNAENWDVIFYADTTNWGNPQTWDDSKVALKTTAPVYALPMSIETFTMSLDSITSQSAVLGMYWENAYIGVPFTVPTDNKVLANINDVMNGNPTADDYFAAAVYYLQELKDINRAQEWMEKAMSMIEKPAFWQLRQQSLIYAKAGNKKAAIETAKKSLAGAEAAGNADYVKMNTDSLKEWEGM